MCIDDVEAQRAVEKYCDMYPAFQDTRECKLLRVSLFITINCCEVNNINFKKDILLSYWRNRDDNDIDDDSKLGQHGHFDHWYHVMIVNVEPRLGKTQFIHSCSTPNSQRPTHPTNYNTRLLVVHVSYVIPMRITYHSFSRFNALALAFLTLQWWWGGDQWSWSIWLQNCGWWWWLSLLIMGLMALIDFKLSATMATVLVTED